MATLTAAAGGGNFTAGGSWVGGVAPTASDDVLLTATSGSITADAGAVCRSIDCTGFTNTLTISNVSNALTIGDGSGGACKFVSTMTLTISGTTSTITFVSSQSAATFSLTTASKVMPNLTINTTGATPAKIQFADAVTATGATIKLTAGALDFNSQSVTCGTWTYTAGTLTTGTQTLTCNGAATTFAGGGKTYSTVALTGSGTAAVTGANTFAAFTRTGTAVKTDAVSFAAAQTVTGTFTVNGNSTTNRVLVQSNTVGTSRTITAATVTTSNIDVQDITGAGAGSWNLAAITGNSGDCGGNSGITFTASTTRYGVVAGNWSATATWSASSGGAGGSSVPLPQDAVILDANSAAGTYAIDMPRIGKDFTCTGFTRTLTQTVAASMFGSLIFASGMTLGAVNILTLAGRSTHTHTSAGKSWGSQFVFQGPGSTYTLQDALSCTSSLTVNDGTFTTNDQAVTCSTFTASSGRTTTLNLGASAISMTSTTGPNEWNTSNANTTVNAGTSTMTITTASTTTRTFVGGGKTYGTLQYTVAGSTGGLTITGANTFATINFSDASNARTLALTASTTTTVTTFTVNGTAGLLMSVVSSAGGTAATLALANPSTMNYLSVQDITATPSNAVYVLDGTNVSGNTGIVFEPNTAQHPSLRLTLIPAIAARGGGNAAAQRASSW